MSQEDAALEPRSFDPSQKTLSHTNNSVRPYFLETDCKVVFSPTNFKYIMFSVLEYLPNLIYVLQNTPSATSHIRPNLTRWTHTYQASFIGEELHLFLWITQQGSR